jgi:hypothetical protein
MSTPQKILQYCTEPRLVADIAAHCELQTSSIYPVLGDLQRHNRIQKIGDGRKKFKPVMFVTIRQAPVATASTDDYENLVITHAHNPFGIKP